MNIVTDILECPKFIHETGPYKVGYIGSMWLLLNVISLQDINIVSKFVFFTDMRLMTEEIIKYF